jgi:hypothetical protein
MKGGEYAFGIQFSLNGFSKRGLCGPYRPRFSLIADALVAGQLVCVYHLAYLSYRLTCNKVFTRLLVSKYVLLPKQYKFECIL